MRVVPDRTAVIGAAEERVGYIKGVGEENFGFLERRVTKAITHTAIEAMECAQAARDAPSVGVRSLPESRATPIRTVKISSAISKAAGARNCLFPQKKPLTATYAAVAVRETKRIFKGAASVAKTGILSANGNNKRVMGMEMHAPKIRAAINAPPMRCSLRSARSLDTVLERVMGIPPQAAVWKRKKWDSAI